MPSGGSDNPTISRVGRFVTFTGYVSDLVSGDTNGRSDVFVRDRLLGITERVSASSSGKQGNDNSGHGNYAPSVSDDGRFVAFESDASNLAPNDAKNAVDVFLRDRLLGTRHRVNEPTSGEQPNTASYDVQLIADGSQVFSCSYASNLLPDDLNQNGDIFVSSSFEVRKARVWGRVRFTGLSPSASLPATATMRITPGTGAPYQLEVRWMRTATTLSC